MNERKDSRPRRRPRGRKPAAETSRDDEAGGTAPLPPEKSIRRIGRVPAVDREAIAAREAGIYNEQDGPVAPASPAPEARELKKHEEPRRERGRRRRKSAPRREESAPPRRESRRRPEPAPAPEPEPEEYVEVAIPNLDEDVDWDLPAAREVEEAPPEPKPERRRERRRRPERKPKNGPAREVEAEPAPDPEPKPEPAPQVVAEPEPEPEEDGFDLGLFEPEPEVAAKPEPEPTPVEEPVNGGASDLVPDTEPVVALAEAPDPEVVAEPPAEPEPDAEDEASPAGSPRIPRQWMDEVWAPSVTGRPERKEEFVTSSGHVVAPLYIPSRRDPQLFPRSVGFPGEFPYTRGVHGTMYRGRLWTMRQYAGFATAKDTNERFKYLLDQGQTGLSVAFDLPTQIGYDSDDARSAGEVGKVGVPINSLGDMEALLDGIPLDKVSLSMTINSTALILQLMVAAVARKQGVPVESLRGTVQNDMLKEFVARNTDRFPLDAHLRLTTDLFRYSAEKMPRWNMISVSGYHMREAGCTAVQEVAFTLANGIAYVEKAVEAGLSVDDFAGRISFFFGAHNNVLEEVAKFRAARRMWARIMKDRFGATSEKSMMLRFHTQTCGSTLTATQPITNVVRVALQALSGVLGGTQSLHTNSWDEALGLPTQESALLALRTQQVIAHESGTADVVDPLGGSPYIEDLTDQIERDAKEYLATIDEMGGAVEAIRAGWTKNEIEVAAYEAQKRIESGESVVVGVNQYQMADESEPDILMIDEERERSVVAGLQEMREGRNKSRAEAAIAALEIAAAWGDADLPELILECVESYCTIGEICESLGNVLGSLES